MKRINLSINMMMNQRYLHILAVLFALLPTKALTSPAVADTESDKAGTILIDPWDDIADVSREVNSTTGVTEAIVTYEKVNDVDASLNVPNNSYVHFDPAKAKDYYVMYHSDKVLPGVPYKLQIVFAPETKEGNVLNNQVPSKVDISTGYHNQNYSSSNELVSRFVLPAAEVTTYEAENIVSSENDFYLTVKSNVTGPEYRRGMYARVIRIAEIRLIPNEEDFSTIEDGGINYTIVPASNYALVCANPNKYTGDVVIPASFTHGGVNYSVGSVNSHAFENCSGLTSVTIPSSVTYIGEGAFAGCDHLATVKVERSQPVNISEDVFTNCANATLYVPRGSITAYRVANGWKDFKEIVEYGEDSVDNIIAFVDAKVKALCVANWDTNGDGELSIGEAAAVKDLSTVFKENSVIRTFDELQYYTGLMSIGDRAFYGCRWLRAITIPNSVTSIGKSAFYGCERLTSITISNSVTSIGDYAFDGCIGLTSVTIPNSVTSIGEWAFRDCRGLTSITIPNSVKSIGVGAFIVDPSRYRYGRASLASITVESGNPVYDSRDNCNAIIKTETNELIVGCNNTAIPNSVTSIGDYAFSGCSGLTSITIGNSVTSIGASAFVGCSGLTSVTIPNSVTNIGSGAFNSCSGLTSVTIPNSVTSISDYAFAYCSGLTSITIPNSVTSIGYAAFAYCSGLTSVKVESISPISITEDEFWGSNYTNATLYVPKGSKAAYEAVDIWKNFKEIVEYGEGGDDNIIVFAYASVKALCVANWDTNGDGELSKDEAAAVTELGSVFKDNSSIKSFYELQFFTGLTSIGESAFSGCSLLTSITIPNSVTSINDYAFDGCERLTSITIPNSVTSIGKDAFNECRGLTSITIPGSVTSIGSGAFSGCSLLTSITIPNSVTSISDYAFAYCSGLTSITIPNSVTSIGSGAFRGCSGLTSITIGNSVTSIGDNAFNGCSGLASITIPNSVMSIGEYAFRDCSGLTSITISNSVTRIYTGTFYKCSGLTSVTIPNSVTSIWKYAFWGCSGLTSVTIPNSVTSIGSDAFRNCSGLTSVTIPNSVTSIGAYAFLGCSGLSSVTIPNSVWSLGGLAFYECSGLTSITIGSGITRIEDYTFAKCPELTDVTCMAESVPNTGNNAFADSPINNTTLHVPETAMNAYKTTAPWSGFGKFVTLTGEEIADPVEIDGIWYYLDSTEKQAEVTKKSDGSYSGAIVIPEKVTYEGAEYSVTSIGNSAFYICTGLTSITIPNSVTSIGSYAFYYCRYLRDVTCFAESVPSTDVNAFSYSSINNATLHVLETSIDAYKTTAPWSSFGIFEALSEEEIAVPVEIDGIWYYLDSTEKQAEVTKKTDGSYSGAIVIPEKVTCDGAEYSVRSIGYAAFRECSGLTSIAIPNSVTSIITFAFEGCSGLTSITIPNSVTYIGYDAFYGCSGLTSITIPNSVRIIHSFRACSGLTSINVEEGNTIYDSRENCNAIIEKKFGMLIAGCKNTTIPNSVTCIGDEAFYGCSGLTSITIPNSVTSISYRAFDDCSGLTSITIPNSVTSISNYAFSDCSGLTSITIGNSVTSIGWGAFEGCSGLTSITIPNSMTSIEGCVFSGCSGLTSVTIPNSVTSIGNAAFSNCSVLTSIDIPGSVMSIGSDAFAGCSNLTAVKMEHSTPLEIKEGWIEMYFHSKNIFSNRANATLYVPKGSKAAYEASEFWSKFKEIVEYDESTDPTGIDGTDSNADEAFEVYDMSGRKVRRQTTTLNDLPKGVYIIGGRKQVVR